MFWNLRYRKQKDVFVGVLRKLQEAHCAECRRQIERLNHELQIAQLKGVHVDDIRAQAEALVAQLDNEGEQ